MHCGKNNNNFSSPYFAHYSAFNLINMTMLQCAMPYPMHCAKMPDGKKINSFAIGKHGCWTGEGRFIFIKYCSDEIANAWRRRTGSQQMCAVNRNAIASAPNKIYSMWYLLNHAKSGWKLNLFDKFYVCCNINMSRHQAVKSSVRENA